jgi:hypothetical protein
VEYQTGSEYFLKKKKDSLVFFCRLRPLTFIKESEKTDLLRKNTKKIYKAEIEKQTCRGAAGNELETHLSRWGDWD